MRLWRKTIAALALCSLFVWGAQAEVFRPVTPKEGEGILAEAIRFATVEWQQNGEQHIGVPYYWGGRLTLDEFAALEKDGATAEFGVDASGLVIAAMQSVVPHHRYRIVRGEEVVYSSNVDSSTMYAWNVEPIAVSELQPGDLIFFGSGEHNVNGVAIFERWDGPYVRFVVASANSGRVVQTSANIEGTYWATQFVAAGRPYVVEIQHE